MFGEYRSSVSSIHGRNESLSEVLFDWAAGENQISKGLVTESLD